MSVLRHRLTWVEEHLHAMIYFFKCSTCSPLYGIKQCTYSDIKRVKAESKMQR